MRISIVEDDQGYVVDSLYWRVSLDGVELHRCVTADEERGEAWVFGVRNSDGEWTTVRLVGKVRIDRIECDGTRYVHGTVGARQDDGFWYWAEPSNPDYESLRVQASHVWDSQEHVWLALKHLVRS